MTCDVVDGLIIVVCFSVVVEAVDSAVIVAVLVDGIFCIDAKNNKLHHLNHDMNYIKLKKR